MCIRDSLLYSVILAVIGYVALRYARKLVLNAGWRDSLAELDLPVAPGRWHEFATAQDSVGRLVLPELRQADEIVVHGVGNPLLDHRSYFELGAPVTSEIANEVLGFI